MGLMVYFLKWHAQALSWRMHGSNRSTIFFFAGRRFKTHALGLSRCFFLVSELWGQEHHHVCFYGRNAVWKKKSESRDEHGNGRIGE